MSASNDLDAALAAWQREPTPRRAAGVLEAAPVDGTATDWHRFLERTRRSDFLLSLPDDDARRHWADLAVRGIRQSGYTLETLLAARTAEHPERIYLRDDALAGAWTYRAVRRRARAVAAALLTLSSRPRVALWTPNSLPGAVCDLACLCHGLFITPLSPGLDLETVAWICRRLEIDILVTGGAEQHHLAARLREGGDGPRHHVVLDASEEAPPDAADLAELTGALSPEQVDTLLERHPRFGMDDPATAMFTSGSTGRPKGVVFTLANMVSKRFARAAALPAVGDDEVLYCYLPLFHTFGRFLELQGTLFWGGTYVFAPNPSRETLLRELPRVCPTGLIGVPIRWQQLRERCDELAGPGNRPEEFHVRSVVGDRLRWGLSAAGYLDPGVFRFFHRHGIELCSGFGMTEATGGITMTPPGRYRDRSVGIPLPGIEVRLGEHDELQIRGPYVAAYLDPEPAAYDGDWLRTGDIFRRHEDGHLEIVDRLKDIYKNSRGQTIAPRRVEQRFAGVPGIRRVFLVGDHRNDNVLLIVPDPDDPVLEGDPHSPTARSYFNRIITSANAELLPHERVVNFAILDRDFSAEQGELTPKGSYRRKVIEANFAAVIDELYRREAVLLRCGDVTVRVPRWLVRELGVLETELVADGEGIRDTSRGLHLVVARIDERHVRVGDLQYELDGDRIHLGRLVRHPLLWVGNDALVRFFPVRDGWDAPLAPFSRHVELPRSLAGQQRQERAADLRSLRDRRLPRLHELSVNALFGDRETALAAVEGLARSLELAERRVAELIRLRLEALARHPEMAVRSRAYRALLLDETSLDPEQIRPKFLESGLPFLDEETIAAVTGDGLEQRRLEAFRRRLHAYRRHIRWPADDVMRSQLEGIFSLLAEFARRDPTYYGAVRDELVSWITLCGDERVAAAAEQEVLALAEWYEGQLSHLAPPLDRERWREVLLFQEGLGEQEIERILDIVSDRHFLERSIQLAFDGQRIRAEDLLPDGVWVGRLAVRPVQTIYRLSLNTRDGRHFDLQLIVWNREELARSHRRIIRSIYWLISLSGHPHGSPVLPRFGCFRQESGALSLAYVETLPVWERIEEYAREFDPSDPADERLRWQRLFIQSLATFFRAWAISGGRIVPGLVDPANVAVDPSDFRESSRILSLSGWHVYGGPLDLVRPMLRNFYKQTFVTFPRTRRTLELSWIADACVEALGPERADAFLVELQRDLEGMSADPLAARLAALLPQYRRRCREEPYLSCALLGASARYRRWLAANPEASPRAREQLIEEMLQLYGLQRQPPLQRYLLYRTTWFRDAPPAVQEALDRLLATMHRHPERPVTNLPELSDLQSLLTGPDERRVFQRMVFPHSRSDEPPELLTVGEQDRRQVAVSTRIRDRDGAAFTVREPVSPAEVGVLYRLFFQSGYYRTISPADRVLVVLDEQDQVVGGISWRPVDREIVHLNGIVVATPLLGHGLSSAMIEDFCGRLANLGYNAVKTLFVMRPFFEKMGFRVDRRWGGLVRPLADPPDVPPTDSR